MIKGYFEFINERKFSRSSGSGHTKEIDNILDEPTTNKSVSSGLMLRDRLREEESDVDLDNLRWKIRRYYATNPAKLKLLLSNLNFLKRKLKKNGELRCEYCDKGPLTIYDTFSRDGEDQKYLKFTEKFNTVDVATCDHKNPRSNGGDSFNEDNLAVCCLSCNKRKKSIDYDEWMHILDKHRVNGKVIFPDEPSNEYRRILGSISRNKIFIIDSKEVNKFISFRSISLYDYLDIDNIVNLIARKKAVVENLGGRKYIIKFNI